MAPPFASWLNFTYSLRPGSSFISAPFLDFIQFLFLTSTLLLQLPPPPGPRKSSCPSVSSYCSLSTLIRQVSPCAQLLRSCMWPWYKETRRRRRVAVPSMTAAVSAAHLAEQQPWAHPVPSTRGAKTLRRNEKLGKILDEWQAQRPIREHLLAWGSYLISE